MPSVKKLFEDRAMTRMISFRLSEEQYQQFMGICEASDVRSVSEATRNLVQLWLEQGATKAKGDLQHKLLSLEEQVARLNAKVERLSGGLGGGHDGGLGGGTAGGMTGKKRSNHP